jgi:hypothetical protein
MERSPVQRRRRHRGFHFDPPPRAVRYRREQLPYFVAMWLFPVVMIVVAVFQPSALAFAVLVTIGTTLAQWQLQRRRALMVHGAFALGRVVRIGWAYANQGKKLYYTFKLPDGTPVDGRATVFRGDIQKVKPGSRLPVMYWPDRPTRSQPLVNLDMFES